jgi:hypothetical protein
MGCGDVATQTIGKRFAPSAIQPAEDALALHEKHITASHLSSTVSGCSEEDGIDLIRLGTMVSWAALGKHSTRPLWQLQL